MAIPESFVGAPVCSSASSVYAEAKRYAETLCSAARSQAQLPTITVRPFSFVGPFHAVDKPWAVDNFIDDALQGSPIRVLGDGQTVRSYMYGADLAFWLSVSFPAARRVRLSMWAAPSPLRWPSWLR